MSMNDVISDVLTRIRNGQMATAREVITPWSKLSEAVVSVLKEEGFVEDYRVEAKSESQKELIVVLNYFEGEPVIKEIKRVSTPGRRVYKAVGELPRFANGLGISIISTSKGVMTDFNARQHGVGGEVVCSVF